MANDTVQTVDRQRLSARFASGLNRRLTVVEAPLGYGKTTLIDAWIAQLRTEGHDVALIGFESAPRHKFERVAECLSELGFQYDETTGLSPLLEGAAAKRRFLVLDDFHEADESCRAFVHDVLRAHDQGLHIVIGTREPPGVPLTRLRMADQVNDFTAEDLRFDLSEAIALFQNELPEQEVRSYLQQAEGWVAALQLLRQFGLRHGTLAPGFEQLAQFGEYLNEQYLDQLAPEQRQLLIHTAHVERVDGDLANVLTGRTDGWVQLERLSVANALIYSETQDGRTRYRYHSLLRDFLRRKQQHLGQAQLTDLHRAASEWFEREGQLFEAMQHALLAGASARAERLLLDAGGVQYGMLHGAGRLTACLELLSEDQVTASARLLLIRAYAQLKTGRIREATELLETLRSEPQPQDDELEREIILIEAHARLYSDAAMSQQRLDALEHAVASSPATDSLTRGMLSNFLCIFLFEFGRFTEAREYGEQAMAHYNDIGAAHLQFFMFLHLSAIDLEIVGLAPAKEARHTALELCNTNFPADPSLRTCAEIYHAETLFEAGETEGLAKRLQRSLLRMDRMEGWNTLYLAGYETCIGLLIEEGAFDEAAELCEHAGHLVNRRGMKLFLNQLLVLQLELAVRAGARGEARRLAGELNAVLDPPEPSGRLRWRGRVRAELAMARFEAENEAEKAALHRLERAARYCRTEGLPRLEMRALVRKFCLEVRLERPDDARQTLIAYLALARRHGSFGAALRDRGDFHKAALWLVDAEGLGRFPADDIRLLARTLWAVSGQSGAGEVGNILQHLLSEKESLVLGELVKGHANKVIARGLDITEPTVKFHLRNIYRKLGINSRKLAIEIAHEHSPSAP